MVMEYNQYGRRIYPPDKLRWDINLCDVYYEGDPKPHGYYKVQSITVDLKLERIVKYLSAVLESYQLVKLGSNFSGAYSQYGPKNNRVINKTVTQWCLIFEGNLLER